MDVSAVLATYKNVTPVEFSTNSDQHSHDTFPWTVKQKNKATTDKNDAVNEITIQVTTSCRSVLRVRLSPPCLDGYSRRSAYDNATQFRKSSDQQPHDTFPWRVDERNKSLDTDRDDTVNKIHVCYFIVSECPTCPWPLLAAMAGYRIGSSPRDRDPV